MLLAHARNVINRPSVEHADSCTSVDRAKMGCRVKEDGEVSG